VNNIETLANVPHIVSRGADWFKKLGTPASTGNILCGVSGDVAKPGVFEIPLGMPVKEIIEKLAGGVANGGRLKAIIPGGSSSGFLPAEIVETLKLDHDSLKAIGSFIGTAGIVVFDESRCMVRATKILCQFYHHETCGQCTQCREGCAWLDQICGRIENGQGEPDDVTTMLAVADGMRARTICALSDAAAIPVQFAIQHFRREFEEHIAARKCTFGNPPMETHADGRHDEEQLRRAATVHTDVLTLHGLANPDAGRYQVTG
jgi:NADH-quinone oxidoreductase subunit F